MKYVFIFLSVVALAGIPDCKPKPRTAPATDSAGVEVLLDSVIYTKLASFDIQPDYLGSSAVSPDLRFIALAVDSSVRFTSADEMWIEEWPDDWYAVRSRRILYLFDTGTDSISKLGECEEIINLYLVSTSEPVQPERAEHIEMLVWSPDSKRFLVVKDREAEGVKSQEILVFTPGSPEPSFLDVFPVWLDYMKNRDGAHGTEVRDISWASDSAIKVTFTLAGVEGVPAREGVFDLKSGKAISVKEIQTP